MRLARYLTLAVLALAFSATPAHADVDLGNGAWCWFADPRAIESQGHTYIGTVDTYGSIKVTDVNHVAGTIRTNTLYPQLQRDDHANPALQLRADGRLVVYYSRHAGANMAYRVSTKPRDITSFEPARNLPNNIAGQYGFTYPNPIKVAGKTFLFWRGANFSAAYSTQVDGTESWTPAQELIKGNEATHTRPYVKYDTDGTTIAVAFTNAHPAEAPDVNIYYVAIRAGNLWHADGTLIGSRNTPIAPSQADLVQDLPENAWVSDVALEDGKPVIVYASFPSKTDHRYWYARWTGSGWENHEITAAGGSIQPDTPTVSEPYYSGGITLDHADPSRVVLSRQVGDGWQVEDWVTPDDGATWTSSAVSDSSTKNVRPIIPRGGTDPLWMSGEYRSYTSYGTSIMAAWDERLTQPVPPPLTSPPPIAQTPPVAVPAPPVTPSIKQHVQLQQMPSGKHRLRVIVTCALACNGKLLVVRGGRRIGSASYSTMHRRTIRIAVRRQRHLRVTLVAKDNAGHVKAKRSGVVPKWLRTLRSS